VQSQYSKKSDRIARNILLGLFALATMTLLAVAGWCAGLAFTDSAFIIPCLFMLAGAAICSVGSILWAKGL
jgi:hypothetical protein